MFNICYKKYTLFFFFRVSSLTLKIFMYFFIQILKNLIFFFNSLWIILIFLIIMSALWINFLNNCFFNVMSASNSLFIKKILFWLWYILRFGKLTLPVAITVFSLFINNPHNNKDTVLISSLFFLFFYRSEDSTQLTVYI